MSDIFEQMIAQHTIAGDNDRKNALYEVMQQVVLSGLYRGGFFTVAVSLKRQPSTVARVSGYFTD